MKLHRCAEFDKPTSRREELCLPAKAIAESLERFVQGRARLTPEEERARNHKLRQTARHLENTEAELNSLRVLIEEGRRIFVEVGQKLRAKGTLAETIRRNAEERLARALPFRTVESSLRILITSLEHERQKTLLREKVEWWEVHLQATSVENRLWERNKREACTEMKRRYSDCLARYDLYTGNLRTLRDALLCDRELLEREYTDLRNRLIAQRALFQRSKEERQRLITKMFLQRLDKFRQSCAARIIQRAWRLRRDRAVSKKRKHRK